VNHPDNFPIVSSRRAYESGMACAVCFVVVLLVLVASLIDRRGT
jgi:hypothetical protein